MKSIQKTPVLFTAYLFLFSLIIYHLYNISFIQRHQESDEISSQLLSSSTEEYLSTPHKDMAYVEVNGNVYIQTDDFSVEMKDTEETREANMINTPGCSIPLFMVNYRKDISKRKKTLCGTRIIHLERHDKDHVQATINDKSMRNKCKMGYKYKCCYRFFQRSNLSDQEHSQEQYTSCKTLRNTEKIRLESDFINVQCFQYHKNNRTHLIYEDDFAFCRKKRRANIDINKSRDKFNVLIIGMDSMSLPRFAQSMPRTVKLFQTNHWFTFQGYHKVGDNSLPNLLPILTGKHSSEIIKKCFGKMDQCNEYFLWNTFKKSGYVTAYGEDYVHMPDTFSKNFSFQQQPTDHYMKPFFINREREINNRSILCSGKSTSGGQVLDFALDFALTYRNDSFFGFFWIHSFSHNINNHPEDADLLLENFFNTLMFTSTILDNTFIIIVSDHGIRFGKHRLRIESYYDNRLPCLFLFAPRKFKIHYPDKLKAILLNQFRLITPYDLFETLNEINELEVGNPYSKTRKYETLLDRQSIFKFVSPNRTCYDVGIHEKWCSCHEMYPVDLTNPKGVQSVHLAVSQINKATQRCWYCFKLPVENISRIHFYYNINKTKSYYVVAFSISSANIVYEAIVVHNDTNMDIIGNIDILWEY